MESDNLLSMISTRPLPKTPEEKKKEAEISINSDTEKLEIYSENYPFRLALRIQNFENSADLNKFVKNCEKLLRGSNEYSLWRSYIIDVLGVNTCAITNELMSECTVEVHHHIPSLFSLLKAIILKKIEHTEEFSTFDICLEGIKLHFQNKIGFVPLVKSIHEKFHNGFLTVPIGLVLGDYNYILAEYGAFMDDEDMDTIQQRLSITESNCTWIRNTYAEHIEKTA